MAVQQLHMLPPLQLGSQAQLLPSQPLQRQTPQPVQLSASQPQTLQLQPPLLLPQQQLQQGAAEMQPLAANSPTAAGGGGGVSLLVNTLQGAPSWLGSDVLCGIDGPLAPPLPAQLSDNASEVSQPSPTPRDPPAQLQGEPSGQLRRKRSRQQASGGAPASLAAVQAQQGQQGLLPSLQPQAVEGRLEVLPSSKRFHPGLPSEGGNSSRLPLLNPMPMLPSARPGMLGGGRAGAEAGPAGEVVPLDAVLEAWEAHDRVNRQLAEAAQQLERQQQEMAALEQRCEALHTQLAAATANGCSPGEAPAAAAYKAVQARMADMQALLPGSVRLHLMQLLPQQVELLPHAAAICDLGCQAAEAALAAYAAPVATAASALPNGGAYHATA